MSQLSKFLRDASDESGGKYLTFRCPGCNSGHTVKVAGSHAWGWNGDANNPTFTPSVLATGLQTVNDENACWTGEWVLDSSGKGVPFVCHSFVTDGRIQFLSDCTHELAGQTVDLPDWHQEVSQ